MENLLQQLGLTENETKVYLAFLKHGEKVAADIARLLKMDKSSAYRAVETLTSKSLLIPNPKTRGTTYTAASPEVLKELIKAKQIELNSQLSSINQLIDTIKNTQKDRGTYILVEKGLAAVQRSMNRTLEAAIKGDKIIKEKYRLDFPYFFDKSHRAFVDDFAKRRIKAGVSIQQIVNFAGRGFFSPIMKTDKKLLKEIHLMPKEMEDDFDGVRIGGDNVTIISFDKNKDYIVVTINDPFVAKTMRSMFDFIWKHSQVYTK